MARHRHREHQGEALAQAARTALERAGESWTEMRANVFAALSAHGDRPVSAYDIAERLSATRGRRVAPNSVYRILDLFVGANLATKVESANAYVVNSHPGCRHDCIFMLCERCRAITHVDDDPLTGRVRAAAQASGFVPSRPVIEVRGVCAQCQ